MNQYPTQNGGQWSPTQPPATSQPPPQQQQQQQQQQPQQWSPQPANGQYTPRPNQIPPISQAVPQGAPAMQTLQPQHPDQYRALPAPPQMYAPPYQQPMQPYPPAQPAPRQRTAIACRYCRRRKIRCSGFDQSEDGRCTNCQRFSQECIFTPVSAQTQAFVPAHTVWRGQNPPQNAQLYGAYGQPIPNSNRDSYPPQNQQPGQYPPPPQGYQQPPNYQQPPGGQPGQPAQNGQQAQTGQKRPTDEPHTPTLPPPNPNGNIPARIDGQYNYPDQSLAGTSPTPSTAHFDVQPPAGQPYYASSAGRISPGGSYLFEPSRNHVPSHTLGSSGTSLPPSSDPVLAPGQVLFHEARTSAPPDRRSSATVIDGNEGSAIRSKEEQYRSGDIKDNGVQTEFIPSLGALKQIKNNLTEQDS